jgi:hypothetical protein
LVSFRYHLVSAIGFFLFLAVGIVVGTTALNGPITKDLRRQVHSLQSERNGLASENKALGQQLDDANQFVTRYASGLLANKLQGQKVLVISMPGARSDVRDGITTQIAAAGGSVSGQLQVTPSYIDPSNSAGILSLATGAARPIDITLTPTSDAAKLGAELLASVLVGKGAATDLEQVLGGFSGLHMVTASGSIAPSKTVIVVGTGALPKDGTASTIEFALVSQLQNDGAHVVVAGDEASASGNGLVSTVRDKASSSVSTVDNATTAMGQVSTILATVGALQSKVGQYGSTPGAQKLFP